MTPDEFAEFYVLWHPQLVRYFGRRGYGGLQDADDLAQDLFTGLAVHVERLRPDTADRYLWVIAHRLLGQSHQWRYLAPTTFDSTASGQDVTYAGWLFRQVERMTAEDAEDQAIVDAAVVDEQLAVLSPQAARIVVGTVLEDRTLAEVAASEGLSVPQTTRLRTRALIRLKQARRFRLVVRHPRGFLQDE